MNITICGSMSFESKMAHVAETLESAGHTVMVPNPWERGGYVGDPERDSGMKRKFIDEHLAKIDASEAILVVNEQKNGTDGYVGGNTLMEMAYAYGQGLDIFLLNHVPDVGYGDEIRGVGAIALDGEVAKVDDYIASLPLVYMSTESALKHRAVSRAMRRAGVPVRVGGAKVPSGVNEQPMTIEETYEGAINRHRHVKQLGAAATYYATIESGQHPAHENHSLFGCTVLVLEKDGQPMKVGIDLDIEYPQEMLDKVPSVYPDLGVLVQQEYGATEKDPYPFFTNGRLTRQKVLEAAFYNLAIQVEG